jgi:hypothetical protein
MGEFKLALPDMPAGDYRFFADIVHEYGFPETIVGSVSIASIAGKRLEGDDGGGACAPVTELSRTAAGTLSGTGDHSFSLPDGHTMIWKSPGQIVARTPQSLEFELLDGNSRPATDEALYMEMPGHAAIVKTDGSVFAHIHPHGSMAMAAFMMANPQMSMRGNRASDRTTAADMAGMPMTRANLPAVVGFPYGFPSAGHYRIFVQMKHSRTIETGVFDADVAETTAH